MFDLGYIVPIKLRFCFHCVVKGKGLKEKHDVNIDRRNEERNRILQKYRYS